MSTNSGIASAYAAAVLDKPELQNAAVRIGLWLASIAERQGGFPVEAHASGFRNGIKVNGEEIPGVKYRPETVNKSLDALEEAGLLSIEIGNTVSGGVTSRLYTLELEPA